ncbi:MAG TPA: hypothetical protein VMJ75_06405 [Candidatus Acidoferrales bacterium]|nr:hypothetical protein [Candidatus Acidoferrales bacterium]
MRYPLRVTAGLLIAALLCLWGAFQSYAFESEYQRQNPDPFQISAAFRRLDPVRGAVPDRAVMGYLTDLEPGSGMETAMFLTAQYVLAPRLLERNLEHAWVLGNFTRPADFAALGKSKSLRLERDFGAGVVLFRREK